VPSFYAYQVNGATFGDYAAPVHMTWDRITSDSAGFSLRIHDLFYGVYLHVSGAGPILTGDALIDSDELAQDST